MISLLDHGIIPHSRFLYEKHRSFEPVQTMGTLPGIGFLDKVVKGDIPGLSVDLGNLLHAEHYIKIYRQVKSTNTSFTSTNDKLRLRFDVHLTFT